MNLSDRPADSLLRLFVRTLDELQRRKLIRSGNNPVADYAENVAARALRLTLAPNSRAGYDGTDAEGCRYQIKARRVTSKNKSRQLSVIRNLEQRPFDRLVGIIFNAEFCVLRACIVPVETVQQLARHSRHQNGHLFFLKDRVWNEPGVDDVTAQFQGAANEVCREACGRWSSGDASQL